MKLVQTPATSGLDRRLTPAAATLPCRRMPDPPTLKPAVFFDRDGVVNVSPGKRYVRTWDEFQFTEGIVKALQTCKCKGYLTILITNQRGVFTGETPSLEEIHGKMQARLAKEGVAFDAIYSATGDRDDPRRKPNPTMLLEAALDLGIDLRLSTMVGDRDSDIEAGMGAGVGKTVRIEQEPDSQPSRPGGHRVSSLTQLAPLLERILD